MLPLHGKENRDERNDNKDAGPIPKNKSGDCTPKTDSE